MPNFRQASLALFGQIDQEAVDADKEPSPMNDAVLATIERFLPNSTGLGQRGWFHELEEFLNSPKIREPRSQPFRFPTYEEATEELSGIQPVDGRSSLDFEPLDTDRSPALARAAYALVVLEKIRAAKNGFTDDPIAPDDQLFGMLPGILDSWPAEKNGEPLTPDAKVQALVARIDEMVDRESFLRIAGEEISPQFAERAKPCFGHSRIPAANTAARSTPIPKTTT